MATLSRIVYGVTLNLGNYENEKFELEYQGEGGENLDMEKTIRHAKGEIAKVTKKKLPQSQQR